MSAAIQILKVMFVSVLVYGNVFLTGVNKKKTIRPPKTPKRCYQVLSKNKKSHGC